MNVRILTDRPALWNAALGHRSDVETGKSLSDPWGTEMVLIVDGVKNANQVVHWVSQASPLAVFVVFGSNPESEGALIKALDVHFSGGEVGSFSAEAYGSSVVWQSSVGLFAHARQRRPSPTHGPGRRDAEGRPVLWDRFEDWEHFGTPVSRDNENVIASLYSSTTGRRPLWVQPGYPTVIPNQPTMYQTLSGAPVSGVLCATRDRTRVGGWDVLELSDMARLLGYPPSLFSVWSDLTKAIPAAGARALVRWALQFDLSLDAV